MKRLFGSLLAAGLLFFATAANADKYNLDEPHAFVLFKINHLNIASTYGQFLKNVGTIDIDPADATKNKVRVEIDTESVFSGNKKRDDHLRSPDFFDAKQFPKITFESTAWKKTGDNTYEVTGNLSLHGQTKAVTVTMTQTGAGPDPWGNQRIGFEGTLTVNRLDYGVSFMPDGIGKDVTLMLSFEGVKAK